MLNPGHLHGKGSDQDNLQAQHYGREDGTLDSGMQLVEDKSIIWLNWFYDWPVNTRNVLFESQHFPGTLLMLSSS